MFKTKIKSFQTTALTLFFNVFSSCFYHTRIKVREHIPESKRKFHKNSSRPKIPKNRDLNVWRSHTAWWRCGCMCIFKFYTSISIRRLVPPGLACTLMGAYPNPGHHHGSYGRCALSFTIKAFCPFQCHSISLFSQPIQQKGGEISRK